MFWPTPPSHTPQSQSQPQLIADAALSFLGGEAIAQPVAPVSPVDQSIGQLISQHAHTNQHEGIPALKVTGPPGQDTPPATPGSQSQLLPSAPPATSPRPLPSLLRFVDHDLMQSAAIHNHPPNPKATCTICKGAWDIRGLAPKNPADSARLLLAHASPFLPLWPCGHWVHYRCLIWQASRHTAQRDMCPTCGIQLFVWEGITALTLAVRTNLLMEDAATVEPHTPSDVVALDAENATIEHVIHTHFFNALSQPSKYSDKSPDLVSIFYGVLDALQQMQKPEARWLQYSTQTGHYLYGSWVAICMKRYLLEQHERIQGTEGWNEYMEGMEALKSRIQGEVHKK
jgi:hypothetical protein